MALYNGYMTQIPKKQNGTSQCQDSNSNTREPRKRLSKGELFGLAVILLAGLVLRAGYLREIVDAPDFSSPAVDAGFHDYWARAMVSGNWLPPDGYSDPKIRTVPYLRPPGYPYFLALLYRLSDSSYLVARICQMSLGLINCILAWLIGRHLFGRAVGLIFSAFMSLYWIFIYFEGEFLEPVLLIFLLLLIVLFLILWLKRLAFRYILVAGLLFGLSVLVRPNCLLFLPVLLLWIYRVAHKRLIRRRALISTLVLIAGVVAAVAPVTVRNYVVANDFVPISSNAGINLLIGNNASSEGEFVMFYVPGHGTFSTCYDYHLIVELLERKVGRSLKHSQASRYLAETAFRYIKEHPSDWLKLTLKKAVLFWGPREISHNKDIQAVRESSYVLRNIPLNFPFVLSLFAVGVSRFLFDLKQQKDNQERSLPLSKECWQLSLLILLFIGTYFLSYLPFFNAALYRVPIIPFLLFFGAYGLYHIARLIFSRHFLRTAVWAGLWAGLCLLAATDFFPSLGRAGLNKANGDMYIINGRMDKAISEYSRALQLKPDYAEAYYGMGYAFYATDRFNEAVVHFEKALEFKPNWAEVHDNLGSTLLRLGRVDEALAHHAEALRLNPTGVLRNNFAASLYPDYVQVYFRLADLLVQRGKTDQAIAHLRHAVKLRPDSSKVHNELGNALAGQAKLDEAIACYTEAIRLKPDYAEAHRNLADVLLRQGKTAQAVKHYSEVLRINPADEAARIDLEKAKALLNDGETGPR